MLTAERRPNWLRACLTCGPIEKHRTALVELHPMQYSQRQGPRRLPSARAAGTAPGRERPTAAHISSPHRPPTTDAEARCVRSARLRTAIQELVWKDERMAVAEAGGTSRNSRWSICPVGGDRQKIRAMQALTFHRAACSQDLPFYGLLHPGRRSVSIFKDPEGTRCAYAA